ncbi:hypothetical protein GCM10009099_30150 [Caenispirillum bisanense]
MKVEPVHNCGPRSCPKVGSAGGVVQDVIDPVCESFSIKKIHQQAIAAISYHLLYGGRGRADYRASRAHGFK